MHKKCVVAYYWIENHVFTVICQSIFIVHVPYLSEINVEKYLAELDHIDPHPIIRLFERRLSNVVFVKSNHIILLTPSLEPQVQDHCKSTSSYEVADKKPYDFRNYDLQRFQMDPYERVGLEKAH